MCDTLLTALCTFGFFHRTPGGPNSTVIMPKRIALIPFLTIRMPTSSSKAALRRQPLRSRIIFCVSIISMCAPLSLTISLTNPVTIAGNDALRSNPIPFRFRASSLMHFLQLKFDQIFSGFFQNAAFF